ncbi:MAG: MqnA/MqnD/SBP family protein, partial [Calditrichota bacterium]
MKIGLSDQLIAAPLTKTLELNSELNPIIQSPGKNILGLLEGSLEAAFITPLDFAKHGVSLSLHPSLALVSHGATQVAQLLFQQDLQTIDSIAVYKDDSQYRMLAAVLLNEVYDLECEFEEVEESVSVEELLSKYSACFLEQEDALAQIGSSASQIDIGEEWSDKTEAAFVHLVLAVRDDAENSEKLLNLSLAPLRDPYRIQTMAAEACEGMPETK